MGGVGGDVHLSFICDFDAISSCLMHFPGSPINDGGVKTSCCAGLLSVIPFSAPLRQAPQLVWISLGRIFHDVCISTLSIQQTSNDLIHSITKQILPIQTQINISGRITQRQGRLRQHHSRRRRNSRRLHGGSVFN